MTDPRLVRLLDTACRAAEALWRESGGEIDSIHILFDDAHDKRTAIVAPFMHDDVRAAIRKVLRARGAVRYALFCECWTTPEGQQRGEGVMIVGGNRDGEELGFLLPINRAAEATLGEPEPYEIAGGLMSSLLVDP